MYKTGDPGTASVNLFTLDRSSYAHLQVNTQKNRFTGYQEPMIQVWKSKLACPDFVKFGKCTYVWKYSLFSEVTEQSKSISKPAVTRHNVTWHLEILPLFPITFILNPQNFRKLYDAVLSRQGRFRESVLFKFQALITKYSTLNIRLITETTKWRTSEINLRLHFLNELGPTFRTQSKHNGL